MNSNSIENIVKKSGSSFYLAMKLLPKYKRDAMFAVYAFCRIIDDIADGDDNYELKIRNLNSWRDEIENIFNKEPKTDLGIFLSLYAERFNLEKKDFIAIIDGMQMDLPNGITAPENETLELYCSRVAGAVGLISIKIFGEDNKNAREFAINLGDALQLTNIIRDVNEDAGIGRLYIPKEILLQSGINETEPLKVIKNSNIAKALDLLFIKAEQKFAVAKNNLKKADFYKMYPAFIMMKVYHKILIKTKNRGFNILEPKIKPNTIDLLAVILETFIWGVLCLNKKPSI